MNLNIEIKTLPELHTLGIDHTGTSKLNEAFNNITTWAFSNGLLKNDKAKIGRLFFDSFKDTSPDKVRMNIFLTNNSIIKLNNSAYKRNTIKGKHIVGHFEITHNQFQESWTNLFIWMNKNGYKKRDDNPFEIYHNDFKNHPENKFIVDFYIPIL